MVRRDYVCAAALVVGVSLLPEAPHWASANRQTGLLVAIAHGEKRMAFYERHPDALRRAVDAMAKGAQGDAATALRALWVALWSVPGANAAEAGTP
jgi:hypothetical protein